MDDSSTTSQQPPPLLLPPPPKMTRWSWVIHTPPQPPTVPPVKALTYSSDQPELDSFDLVDEIDLAALKGDLERVKELVKSEPRLAQSSDFFYSRTPLMSACYEGHLEVVKFLTRECHVDLNRQDAGGWTAAYWSAIRGQVDIMAFLLSLGASHTITDLWGHTPLMTAAEAGDESILTLLLHHDPRPQHVNWQNANGASALFLAAKNGHVGCVRLLLEAGAEDSQGRLYGGMRAVDVARERQHTDCEMLLQTIQLYPLWKARQVHNDHLLSHYLPSPDHHDKAKQALSQPALNRYKNHQTLPQVQLLQPPPAVTTDKQDPTPSAPLSCLPFFSSLGRWWRGKKCRVVDNSMMERQKVEEREVAKLVVGELKDDLFQELMAMMAPCPPTPPLLPLQTMMRSYTTAAPQQVPPLVEATLVVEGGSGQVQEPPTTEMVDEEEQRISLVVDSRH